MSNILAESTPKAGAPSRGSTPAFFWIYKGEKMVNLTTRRPLKKEKVVFRDIGDEAVLYNPQTKAIHVLNKTSSLVWESCDGKHSLEMIEKKIKETFEVSNSQDVKDDIRETINNFSEKGLIEP